MCPEAEAGPNLCRIATGQYTGDGTLSQPIVGIGFRPRYGKIIPHEHAESITADGTSKIDVMDTEYALYEGQGVNWYHVIRDNRLTSLDADGFTVDDDAIDAHPNKLNQIYDYVMFG